MKALSTSRSAIRDPASRQRISRTSLTGSIRDGCKEKTEWLEQALGSLCEDRMVAAQHFREVVLDAPGSDRALSSQFWLRLLREDRHDASPDSQFGRAADRLARDLLDRELLVMQLTKEMENSRALQ